MKNFKQYNEDKSDIGKGLGFKPDTELADEGTKAWLRLPRWKQNYTCFLFSLRRNEPTPESKDQSVKWEIDNWYKFDYGNEKEAHHAYNMMKLRQTMNPIFLYGVWLPNDIAEDADKHPEQYMYLLMKYKFKI